MSGLLPKLGLFLLGALVGVGGVYQYWAKPKIAASQNAAQVAKDDEITTRQELTNQLEIANGKIAGDQQTMKSLQDDTIAQVTNITGEAKAKVDNLLRTAGYEKERNDQLEKSVAKLQSQLDQLKQGTTAGTP